MARDVSIASILLKTERQGPEQNIWVAETPRVIRLSSDDVTHKRLSVYSSWSSSSSSASAWVGTLSHRPAQQTSTGSSNSRIT
jgi:hypothetical protein